MSDPYGTNRDTPIIHSPDVQYSVFCEGGFNDGSLSAMAKAEGVALPWPHHTRQEVSGKLLNRMISSGGEFVEIRAVIPKSTKAKPKPKVKKDDKTPKSKSEVGKSAPEAKEEEAEDTEEIAARGEDVTEEQPENAPEDDEEADDSEPADEPADPEA